MYLSFIKPFNRFLNNWKVLVVSVIKPILWYSLVFDFLISEKEGSSVCGDGRVFYNIPT